MEEQNIDYTLTVYSENMPGILYHVCQIFNRRKVNIESLTTSASEVPGVHKYTIVVNTHEAEVKKIRGQVEKIIDVIACQYHTKDDIVYQEIALYKLRTETLTSTDVEKIVRANSARILSVDKDICVIEKTGHNSETTALFETLKPYGIMEFSRSGRIAVTKPLVDLKQYLAERGISLETNMN